MIQEDNFKKCRICGKMLSADEIASFRLAKLPALCEKHLKEAREKLKKCAPLFQKMNFL
jgi:hypothetical protein